jgi:biofilm PGA synthesis N-glycosyltransferase PgaC
MGARLDMYVLITPAKDEAQHISRTIESVLSQTLPPMRWVIVDDGSNDDTWLIAKDAADRCPWIQVLRKEGGQERGFGSKVRAFMAGYNAVGHLPYTFIGNLDADVAFEPFFYETLVREMERNPRLGVASGVVWEITKRGARRLTITFNHAVGATQFWRRQCFEQVGGYRPVSVGGVDALAELTARMVGWQTRSFPGLKVWHLKPVDAAGGRNAVSRAYRAGLTEYHIGTWWLFACLKAVRRWRESPPIISAFVRLAAYFRCHLRRIPRDAPEDLVLYLKKEQRSRIAAVLKGKPDWK